MAYQHIDPSQLLATIGGDVASYRELVAIYLASTPALHDQLQQALAAGDCPRAARVCHSLKTSVLLVGAQEFGEVLRELERFALDGEQAVLPLACTEVARLFALVEQEVRHSIIP
ncbi:MAG: Hpt domain-containing protein [Burkholderiaceae bacterium]|nr:Hpt domain-containing protein [Burkholderiaceae bacterium]